MRTAAPLLDEVDCEYLTTYPQHLQKPLDETHAQNQSPSLTDLFEFDLTDPQGLEPIERSPAVEYPDPLLEM